MKRSISLFLFGLLCVSFALGQSSTKQNPIEALAGKWDIRCFAKGCMMFTDVLIGDPDHPADMKHPQYITMAVAINRKDRKVAYFDFDFPPDADPSQGFFIAFMKTYRKNAQWHIRKEKGSLQHVNFFRCDKVDCIGRVPVDVAEPKNGKGGGDLLHEFLHSSQIWFLYAKNGQAYRAMKALFPFQRDYKHLMETQLK